MAMSGALFPVDVRDASKSGETVEKEQWRSLSFQFSGSGGPIEADSDEDLTPKSARELQYKHRHKRKRVKKERKTRKTDAEKIVEHEQLVGELLRDRRASARTWAKEKAAYYIDNKPDRDNIAYGGLYRADVPKFHRHGWVGTATCSSSWSKARGCEDNQADNRYFSPVVMRQQQRNIRHLKLKSSSFERVPDSDSGRLGDDFVSLGKTPARRLEHAEMACREEDVLSHEEGESTHDYLLQRIRDFNEGTRARPHDAKLWLRFAEFQTAILTGTGQRFRAHHASEKKRDIIMRGLSYNPNSEILILALLDEIAKMEDAETVKQHWKKVLSDHPDSPALWRAYLAQRKTMFGEFRVRDVREDFKHALCALSSARSQRLREMGETLDDAVRELEMAIVDLIIEAARFDLQTGYTELAIGRLQAAAEFSCFGPEASEMSEASRLRQFESFWESGDARAGERGAQGWGRWVYGSKSLKSRSVYQASDWTCVSNFSRNDVGDDSNVAGVIDDGNHRATRLAHATCQETPSLLKDAHNTGADHLNEDEDSAILSQLYLKLDMAAKAEVDDATLNLWIAEEVMRDMSQWCPLRDFGIAAIDTDAEESKGHLEGLSDIDKDPDPNRVVCFDDIREGLIRFVSEDGQIQLLKRIFEFLGCSFYPWDSTADPSSVERLESVEHPSGPFTTFVHGTRNEQQANRHCTQWLAPRLSAIPGKAPSWLCPRGGAEAMWALGAQSVEYNPLEVRDGHSRALFLARLLDLSAAAFPGHAPFALARVEHERCYKGVNSAKACAKRMLSQYHGCCIPLWIVFARLERSSGQKQASRKVYNRIIKKLPSLLPHQATLNAATLALACADDELDSECNDSSGCALGALVWLAEFSFGIQSGDAVSEERELELFPGGPTSIPPQRLLRIRKALQELVGHALAGRIGMQSAGENRALKPSSFGFGANLQPEGVAVVAAAALFEQLVSGINTSVAVFSGAIAAAPDSAQRAAAPAWEILHLRYLHHLQRFASSSMPPVSPSCIRKAITSSLKIFPASPAVLAVLAAHELRSFAHHRLRRYLDSVFASNHNPLLWFLALRVEFGGGELSSESQEAECTPLIPRWRGIFERALATQQNRQMPLLWRCYMGAELASGQVAAAHRIFLRAVDSCPWDKALWLTGIRDMSIILTPSERCELIEVMRGKGILTRTDIYEVKLEMLG